MKEIKATLNSGGGLPDFQLAFLERSGPPPYYFWSAADPRRIGTEDTGQTDWGKWLDRPLKPRDALQFHGVAVFLLYEVS